MSLECRVLLPREPTACLRHPSSTSLLPLLSDMLAFRGTIVRYNCDSDEEEEEDEEEGAELKLFFFASLAYIRMRTFGGGGGALALPCAQTSRNSIMKHKKIAVLIT